MWNQYLEMKYFIRSWKIENFIFFIKQAWIKSYEKSYRYAFAQVEFTLIQCIVYV